MLAIGHKKAQKAQRKILLCLLRLFATIKSINQNQNQNRRLLRRLHHLLERWGGRPQGLRQRPGGRQRRRRIQLGRHDAGNVTSGK
jgi:hypothetical protein